MNEGQKNTTIHSSFRSNELSKIESKEQKYPQSSSMQKLPESRSSSHFTCTNSPYNHIITKTSSN